MQILKRTLALACFSIFIVPVFATDSIAVADTTKRYKNELHLNILPLISHCAFSGSVDNLLQMQYKRSFGKFAFRATANYESKFRNGPDHSISPLTLIAPQPDGSIKMPIYHISGELGGIALGVEYQKTNQFLTAHIAADLYYGYQETRNYVSVHHYTTDSMGYHQLYFGEDPKLTNISRRYYGGILETGIKFNVTKRWFIGTNIQLMATVVDGGSPLFNNETWEFIEGGNPVSFQFNMNSMINVGLMF